MVEKLTAMQDRMSRSLQSWQPCRISIPEMFEKFTAMSQPFKTGCFRHASRHASKVQGCSSNGWKAHSHAGWDVPEMIEKLTAIQDWMSQRCLKADSHAG